jgi:hypothetical protein
MFEPQTLLGGVWSVVLVVIGAGLVVARNRIRVLQYTVNHVPVAISGKDDSFGHIEVMLNKGPVDRLWMTTVTLTNDTGKDFEKLPVRIRTNDDTLMWGQRSEITNSSFQVIFAPDWAQKIKLEKTADQNQAVPTPEQQHLFNHERDFVVPVLNRKDSAKWTIITTVRSVPEGQPQIVGPSVWCDMLQSGVKVGYRPVGPEVWGVPTKRARLVGVAATLIVYGVAVGLLADPWAAAIPSTVIGFIGPLVGAFIYKVFRRILPMVIH